MVKAGFWLRGMARGYGVEDGRRDELLNTADQLLTVFAKDQESTASTAEKLLKNLAASIVSHSGSNDEVQFMIKAVDNILKKRFRSPFKARAMIETQLRHFCANII